MNGAEGQSDCGIGGADDQGVTDRFQSDLVSVLGGRDVGGGGMTFEQTVVGY